MTIQQQHYGRHRHRPSRQWGISLVPVMISISIFTAIAIQYTLPQQQQKQREINVAATQTAATQILQAALNFWADNANWPANISNLEPAYLAIINNNPWGNGWRLFTPLGSRGLVLVTQTRDHQSALALANRFGSIARICDGDGALCVVPSNTGSFVHIGIAPP